MKTQIKNYIKNINSYKFGKKIYLHKYTPDGFIYYVNTPIMAGMDGKIHTIKKIGTKKVYFTLKQNPENLNDFYHIKN